MKFMHPKSGSMVLTCMFFISICMLIMLLQWRSQEAARTIMILRADSIKTQYAAQALLEYGIDLCKKQYVSLAQTLIERRAPIIITFDKWPLDNEQYVQGKLEISYTQTFLIVATLLEAGPAKISLSCHLAKENEQQKDVYTIMAWKRHELQSKTSLDTQ